ncbi:MAG: hypothetical protein ACKVX7_19260 [Planctomycetota bacterium]
MFVRKQRRFVWAWSVVALLASLSFVRGQGPTPGYEYSLSSAAGRPGDEVVIDMFCATARTTQGWSMGVCHDSSLLDVVQVVDGSTTATVKSGSPPDFNQINLHADGWTVGVVIRFLGGPYLAPGSGYNFNDATYALLEPGGVTADLVFCDTLGLPPVATVIVCAGSAIIPMQIPGTIIITALEFRRTDCNVDGVLDIADVVYLLDALFVVATQLACVDACDTNDDGVVNIADAIYALSAQFGGGPPPAPPFLDCGVDPTADALECENYPGSCP